MISTKYIDMNGKVEEIHEVVVHNFTMADVDDPELYVAQPLYEWEHSDQGQWIMKHAVETPVWHQTKDLVSWGYKFCVVAKLKSKDLTYFLLKWQNKK